MSTDSFDIEEVPAEKPKKPEPPAAPKLSLFKPGDIIFNEGDDGDKTYIIKSGSVKIVTQYDDKVVTLGILKGGACFGEMAVITNEPRVATAIAEINSQIYVIDRSHVRKMMDDLPPLFRAIVMSLIKRVKSLNAFAAKKTNFSHPMIAIAHLLNLMYAAQPKSDVVQETNASGMPMMPITNNDVVDEKAEEAEAVLEEAVVFNQIKNILGYTDYGSRRIIQKFIKLRLLQESIRDRKKVLIFNPTDFVAAVKDVLNVLGEHAAEGPTAELEYLDLNELAHQLDLRPQRIMDAIYNGRIEQDALLLRRSVVMKSIEDQGRQLF